MEEVTETLDRFEKACNLGIKIPCRHPALGDDSCHSSSSKKLEIRFVLDYYETLVYYHTNGRRMVAKPKQPQKQDFLINPFCPLCRLFMTMTFLACEKKKIDFAWCIKWLDVISDKMWKKVESLNQQEDGMERRDLRPVLIYNRKLSRTSPNFRVCNEEEFEARICPKTRVYEEEIPVFKGLERISVDNDDDNELLKREDTCGICLQKLKIADIKEGEGEDLKWSKSLGKLPCKHVFHEPCVLRWLHNKNHVCPICRDSVN